MKTQTGDGGALEPHHRLDVQTSFQEAFRLHQSGRLREAEALYRHCIRTNPQHFDALHFLGVLQGQLGKHAEAVHLIAAALRVNPNSALALFNRGNALQQLGRLDEALASYDRALALNAKHAGAWSNRGITLRQLERAEEAVASFDAAIALKPDFAETHYSRGIALAGLKRLNEALASYDRAIALKPGYAEALSNRGNVLHELGRSDEAIGSYDLAIAARPQHARAYNGRGNVLAALDRPGEAVASFERAIAIQPHYPEALNNRGIALGRLGRWDEALADFERAIAERPDYADAFFNRANALTALRRTQEALASCEQAIAIKPDHADAFNNQGLALAALGRREEALASYERAVALKPDYAEALINRGNTLGDLGRHADAVASFERAIALKPNMKYVQGARIHSKLQVCDWNGLHQDCAQLFSALERGISAAEPFSLLAVPGVTAEQQLECAKLWIADAFPALPQPLWRGERYAHGRIRVGYLSADFRQHPVAYLIAQLLELHDRRRFEIIGISFEQGDGSDISKRIANAFDRLIDVSAMPDASAAQMLREVELDIAVDLAGYTRGARSGILARRPAAIQVSYLGYAATMGSQFVDYIIADPIVLPFDQQDLYTESIVHLPGCYLPSDSTRVISERVPSRGEEGLPENSFVYCCFNQSYKLLPETFALWMRVLARTGRSVLWLSRLNDRARANLRGEASAHGIDPARIVFASRLPLQGDHLARHRLAELFLDTLPYNAHSTAMDALWAGLPVLTCMGTTFHSRVASSLLHAVGLPELVTDSLEEYEAAAVRLSSDPALLRSIRQKLGQNRLRAPLFDSMRFTRHLEEAYVTMWERARRREKPLSFAVPFLS